MMLEQVPVGQQVRIQRIDEPQMAMMALRLGIAEGEVLTVSNKIPGGPLVVRRGKVDIALGRELCRSVMVSPLGDKASDG